MAVCKYCGGEFATSPGCTRDSIELDGELFGRKPFGSEQGRETQGERCPGCGVERGSPHHAPCEFEECPCCHEPILSCGTHGQEDVGHVVNLFNDLFIMYGIECHMTDKGLLFSTCDGDPIHVEETDEDEDLLALLNEIRTVDIVALEKAFGRLKESGDSRLINELLQFAGTDEVLEAVSAINKLGKDPRSRDAAGHILAGIRSYILCGAEYLSRRAVPPEDKE